jgi:hypothetical protein
MINPILLFAIIIFKIKTCLNPRALDRQSALEKEIREQGKKIVTTSG